MADQILFIESDLHRGILSLQSILILRKREAIHSTAKALQIPDCNTAADLIRFYAKTYLAKLSLLYVYPNRYLELVAEFAYDDYFLSFIKSTDADWNFGLLGAAKGSPPGISYPEGGHLLRIQMMSDKVQNAPDFDFLDSKYDNALVEATKRGHSDSVKLLLDIFVEAGFQLDINSLPSAVEAAALAGYTQSVKLILAAVASGTVEARTRFLLFAFKGAAKGGHLELLTFIIEQTESIGATANINYGAALVPGAIGGHPEIIAWVADVTRNSIPANFLDEALIEAAAHGNIEYFNTLIDYGANFGDLSKLFVQAARGKFEIFRTVIAQATKVDHRFTWDDYDKAIAWASDGGDIRIVETILEMADAAGIRLIHQWYIGHRVIPLELAIVAGHRDIIDFLFAQAARVGVRFPITAWGAMLARAVESANSEMPPLIVDKIDEENVQFDADYFEGGIAQAIANANIEILVRLFRKMETAGVLFSTEKFELARTLAESYDHPEIERLLIDIEANA